METTAEAQSPVINFVYCFKAFSEEAEQWKAMMVDSVKTIYPTASIYHVDLNCDQAHSMVYRAGAYAQMRRKLRGPMVCLDTDIVAMRPAPLDALFTKEWDIALVKGGDYVLMPWCGGFFMAQDNEKAQAWFDETFRAANSLPEGMVTNSWWVDQLAMSWAAEHIDGLRVMELPQNLFNFVPEKAQSTMAYFVHLKGPRKHLMRQYYNGVKKTDYTGF